MLKIVAKHAKLDATALRGSTSRQLIGRGIDVSVLKSGRLMVRVEDAVLQTGDSIDVYMVAAWPDEQEPLQLIEEIPTVNKRGQVTVTGPLTLTQAGVMVGPLSASPNEFVGPAVDVWADCVRASATTTFTATLSVGILGWEA